MSVFLVEGVRVVFWLVIMGCWVSVVVCFRVKNLCSVGWDNLVCNGLVLMCVEEASMYVSVGLLFVFVMLLVCSAGLVELGILSVGGLTVWDICWSCCVFVVFLRDLF